MAQVSFVFKDNNINKLFPSHGWALNDQSYKILRFPIIHAFNAIPEYRKRKKVSETSHRKHLAYVSFNQTVIKLAIVLRELHKLIREEEQDQDFPPTSAEAFFKLHEFAPIYLDSAYIYLRKIADHISYLGSYMWFEKLGSIPRESFSDFKKFENSKTKNFENFLPLVDVVKLRKILKENTNWFDIIRHPQGGNQGLRDGLIHDISRQLFLHKQGGEGNMRVNAYFHSQSETPIGKLELVSTLKNVLKDFCIFCKEVYQLTDETKSEYDTQWGKDALHISGLGDDVSGFWPEIK